MTDFGQRRWPLVDADQMRALDQHTIQDLGIPGEVLMESAGRAVVECVLEEVEALHSGSPPLSTGSPGPAAAPAAGDPRVAVVCGSGNNGGDGLVIARHLAQQGVSVQVALAGDPKKLRGDVEANYRRALAIGLEIQVKLVASDWRPPDNGVVVDCLFGTGLSRPLTGEAAEIVKRINQARSERVRIVSVDLPSGVDAGTGQELGCAIQADRTVTIGLPKYGLVLEPGRSLAGRIDVARIGIVDSLEGEPVSGEIWTQAGAGAVLPERPADGHKGRFGHLLVVAGSEGKTGAAALVAHGAGRAGAGLVTIACPAGLNDILEVKCTEAMTVPVAQTGERCLAASAADAIVALAGERDLVVAGPGIGRSDDTQALMQVLAGRLECPLVLDADGIVAFEKELPVLKRRDGVTILTPHPGEAALLLGRPSAEINRDRVASARELAQSTGAIVLLKGASTVAADPDGGIIVNPTGGPALATGGTGDVLAGVVAAYLGQGLEPLQAAAAAAFVHGAAADRLAQSSGPSGLMAEELADAIAPAAEALRASARRVSDGGSEGQLAISTPGSRLATRFPDA